MQKIRQQLLELTCASQAEIERLEKQFVSYIPDDRQFILCHTGSANYKVRTEHNLGGWHMVIVNREPYLISHQHTKLWIALHGHESWDYYDQVPQRYLKACYSNVALGATGTHFSISSYNKLSQWIQHTAGIDRCYLGEKVLRSIYYEAATAAGSSIEYPALADTAGSEYQFFCTFRPVVKLSPDMYLIIDDDHDGLSPEKGMILAPAKNYNPAAFAKEMADLERKALYVEAMHLLDHMKRLHPSFPMKLQMDQLEEIINSF